MWIQKAFQLAICSCLTVLLPSTARASDSLATTRPAKPPAAANWPQWHGPNRDNKSPDTGLLKQWPVGGPKLVATISGLHAGFSCPAIADGAIYTTGTVNGRLVIKAFDRKGKEKWKADNGPTWRGADDDPAWGSRYPDSRSTPTVTNGRLYIRHADRLFIYDVRGKG